MSEVEEWRPVPGFEGLYEASSLGRMRSVDRMISFVRRGKIQSRLFKGRLLKFSPNTQGYWMISLYSAGRYVPKTVHRWICETFHGPAPRGAQVAHANGVRTDNRAINLRWATAQENADDKRLHGITYEGESNPAALIGEQQVKAIRAARGREHQKVTAARFGISVTHVCAIQLRKSWKSIE